MKQQGKEWITPEGTPTSAKYLPDYIKHSERLGSRVADIIVGVEAMLQKAKMQAHDLCMEMFKRYKAENPGEADVKRFSFTTFDREFKIEVDVDKNYIRVYRATKPNPKHQDYELVNTDFARANLVGFVAGSQAPTVIVPEKVHESLEAAAAATPPQEKPGDNFEEEEKLTELPVSDGPGDDPDEE